MVSTQRLDELRDISRNSKTYLAQIEVRERSRTGIGSLKVRFNNVFGYYLEISKANMHLAPAGLRAQADAGKRRAVHHARVEGTGRQDPGSGREDPDAGARDLRDASRPGVLARGAHQGDGRGGRGVGRRGGAGGGRGGESLHAPAFFRVGRDASGGRPPSGDREADRARRAALHPQRHLLPPGDGIHRRDHRARTWAASRLTCGRPRCW